MPATVLIKTFEFVDLDEREGENLSRYQMEGKLLGSGIVFDENGFVLTNEHVVRDYKIFEVQTFGGDKFSAKVVYKDGNEDLAILKVTPRTGETAQLQPMLFARPDDLMLGETVTTIGNPLGLTFSIAQGILSSSKRRLEMNEKLIFDDLLQTSIKVNPGNSGGPLINLDGEMIGMMVASQTKANGIGFAIPVARLERFLIRWYEPRNSLKASLLFKVETVFDFQENLVQARVKGVQAEDEVFGSGLQNGHRIIRVNNQPINTALDFYRAVSRLPVDKPFYVQVQEGKTYAVNLMKLEGMDLAEARLGLSFQILGPSIARSLDLPFARGFVLSDVDVSRLGKEFEGRRGDMLFELNGKLIFDEGGIKDALAGVEEGSKIEIKFLRATTFQGEKFLTPVTGSLVIE